MIGGASPARRYVDLPWVCRGSTVGLPRPTRSLSLGGFTARAAAPEILRDLEHKAAQQQLQASRPASQQAGRQASMLASRPVSGKAGQPASSRTGQPASNVKTMHEIHDFH